MNWCVASTSGSHFSCQSFDFEIRLPDRKVTRNRPLDQNAICILVQKVGASDNLIALLRLTNCIFKGTNKNI